MRTQVPSTVLKTFVFTTLTVTARTVTFVLKTLLPQSCILSEVVQRVSGIRALNNAPASKERD